MGDYSKRPNNSKHQIECEENNYEVLAECESERDTIARRSASAIEDYKAGRCTPAEVVIKEMYEILEKAKRKRI